jgi:UDP-glucose 4-epimerase
LRYFNIFGPGQDPKSQYSAFIPLFVVGMLEGQELTIHGDGLQAKDFTYVSNVVEANLLAAEAEGVSGEVFNVGCGARTSVNEVVGHIRKIIGSEGNITYGAPRSGDVPQSLAAIDKAQEKLGYEPRVRIEEGLERVALWYRKRG